MTSVEASREQERHARLYYHECEQDLQRAQERLHNMVASQVTMLNYSQAVEFPSQTIFQQQFERQEQYSQAVENSMRLERAFLNADLTLDLKSNIGWLHGCTASRGQKQPITAGHGFGGKLPDGPTRQRRGRPRGCKTLTTRATRAPRAIFSGC